MNIGKLIKRIYDSEIPCRLEWWFDCGFTWSVQDGEKYPALWRHDEMDNNVEIICETDENILERNNPLLEKDWLARGNHSNFESAVLELADAIVKYYPESEFSKSYKK